MRELRISLPNELWDKFQGQSPQHMKSVISTVICMQFQVKPEPKQRKPAVSVHKHRGDGGRFTEKPVTCLPLRDCDAVDVEVITRKSIPRITQDPEIPLEITVQEPETPPEVTVQRRESQAVILMESKSNNIRTIRIHSAYAAGLLP